MTSSYLLKPLRSKEEAMSKVYKNTLRYFEAHPRVIDGSKYNRAKDLKRVCPELCDEKDLSPIDVTQRNIKKLRRLCHAMSKLGELGRWNYSRALHISLVNALNGENLILKNQSIKLKVAA